jgi:hypothetical protein
VIQRLLRLSILRGAVCFLVLGLAAPSQARPFRRSQKLLLRAPKPAGRFFPALKWRVTLGLEANTVPALADLDLDGALDIVFPSADNALYRLNANGDVRWRVPMGEGITAGVTLADVNRDGALDILLAVDRELRCYDANGKLQWRVHVDEKIQSFASVADLDGDGRVEILFGANDNRLRCVNGEGKPKWSFQCKSWVVGGASTADINGDGKLEVVFGSLDANIYCLDAKGKKVWVFSSKGWVQSSPVLADIDRDGGVDTVAYSDDGYLYCLSRRGTLKWRTRLAQAQEKADTEQVYPAVADLDGEGTLETVVALPDGTVTALTAFGERAWTHSLYGGTRAAPLIADLDNNGWQDIVLVSKEGEMTSLNTWGNAQWSVSLGQTIEATPLLADLNRNGKWEIYVANLMKESRDSGFFSSYEFSSKAGRALWATLKGDSFRTSTASNARDFGALAQRGGDYLSAFEPFGAGRRPQTGVLPPRRLVVTALPLEDTKGNRDGALDAGETALWRVRVSNSGRGPSFDTALTLDPGQTPLSLDRRGAFLGYLAPGATKTATFRLSAPALPQLLKQLENLRASGFRDVNATPEEATATNAKNDALAKKAALENRRTSRVLLAKTQQLKNASFQDISLRVTESGVLAAASRARVLNMPPLPPLLRVHERQILDTNSRLTSGNGNGRLDAGETVVLRMRIVNDNLTTAKNATAALRSGSTGVLVATPSTKLGTVVPYGGRWVSFSLRAARVASRGEVPLTLVTQSTGAPSHSQKISLPMGGGSLDTTPPTFTFSAPRSRIASVKAARFRITGNVFDSAGISVISFRGKSVPKASQRRDKQGRVHFSFNVPLKVGENVFPFSATDARGNSTSQWIRLIRKP